MSQQELLRLVAEILQRLKIPHMVTGSFASSLHGEPRATHDIDLVIEIDESHITQILDEFKSDIFYLSETAIRDAFTNKGMFNLLSLECGQKVDFWILTDDPFDQSRFERARMVELISNCNLRVSTPEDTILAKLKWAKKSGGSEKQMNDANSILELLNETLEFDYLQHWIHKLGLENEWNQLRSSDRH